MRTAGIGAAFRGARAGGGGDEADDEDEHATAARGVRTAENNKFWGTNVMMKLVGLIVLGISFLMEGCPCCTKFSWDFAWLEGMERAG